ncbi:MAG: hypothetical protein MUE95_14040 [Cyclobacteriaceae bacterium]|jgi:hypothetical protein|nr:hypothetical protein [Cyclobacteriaceae bacterium]
MHPILRNILALVAGIILGSIVNMGLINVSGYIIPPPEGIDNTTMEGLQQAMSRFEPKHFLFPFLAHALGTLTGAWLVARLAVSYKFAFAMAIGLLFLAGGIYMVMLLPSPVWFNTLDLGAAYLPMALLGWWLAVRKSHQ